MDATSDIIALHYNLFGVNGMLTCPPKTQDKSKTDDRDEEESKKCLADGRKMTSELSIGNESSVSDRKVAYRLTRNEPFVSDSC